MKRISLLHIVLAAIVLFFLVRPYLEYPKGSDKTEKTNSPEIAKIKQRYTGMEAAMDFFYMSRAYPEKEIPAGKFYEGYEQAKLLRNASTRGADSWYSIGPKNFGGRTLMLAFNPQNPNTMYAGSASGGLWRSFTGGVGAEGWHRMELGFPAVSIPAIAISPVDSNVMYVGTGEVYKYGQAGTGYAVWPTRGFYGIGILKTTDGGATWTKSLDWTQTQMRGVLMIKINPLNPNVVYAGTTEGTYKSNDAGATWSKINNALMTTDILIHPVDTGIVVIASGDFQSTDYGIYRSTNSGATWFKLGTVNGLPNYTGKVMLGICRDFPDNFYASIGYATTNEELYHSTDKGLTWTGKGQIPYTYGWFAHDVAVNHKDPDKIVVAGVEIYKYHAPVDLLEKKSIWYKWYLTANPPGGDEGPPDYAHADIHDIIFHPVDTNVVYFATDGGIFRSTNGGETFQALNGSYQTQQFYQGFSSSQQDGDFSLGGLQDNATAVYEGNISWRRVIGGDGGQTIIHPIADDIVIASTQWSRHYISYDRANFFTHLSQLPYYTYNANFIAPIAYCEMEDKLLAGKEYIYASNDLGSSWNNLGLLDNQKPALAMAFSNQNCNRVYASSTPIYLAPNYVVVQAPPANLFRSDNGGSSWTKITGTLPDRFYNDIAIHPTNDSIVYIAVGGYGTPHIYKTSNSGQTWTAMSSGLPDLPMTAVVIDPFYPDHIYAGNDVGIYVSQDGGLTWTDFSSGLPEAAIIYDLTISPVNKKLRAATHGNGVYEADLLSPIASVEVTHTKIGNISVYPNPVNNEANVSITLTKAAKGTFRIFDAQGKEIRKVRVDGIAGLNKYKITTEGWIKGYYFIEADFGGDKEVMKLLKL